MISFIENDREPLTPTPDIANEQLINFIPGILNSKISHLSEEEINAITAHWTRKLGEVEEVNDLDGFDKLFYILKIIANLKANTMPESQGKYHKRNFQFLILYLKGELTDQELMGGLIEAKLYNFSFYQFPTDLDFSPAPELYGDRNKQKLWIINYCFSGRFRNSDARFRSNKIDYVKSGRLIGSPQDTSRIRETQLKEFKDACPFLSEFVDSHGIYRISDFHLEALKKILTTRQSISALEGEIEIAKRENPSAYFSDILERAIYGVVLKSIGKLPNDLSGYSFFEKHSGFLSKILSNENKTELKKTQSILFDIYKENPDLRAGFMANEAFKALMFKTIYDDTAREYIVSRLYFMLPPSCKEGYNAYRDTRDIELKRGKTDTGESRSHRPPRPPRRLLDTRSHVNPWGLNGISGVVISGVAGVAQSGQVNASITFERSNQALSTAHLRGDSYFSDYQRSLDGGPQPVIPHPQYFSSAVNASITFERSNQALSTAHLWADSYFSGYQRSSDGGPQPVIPSHHYFTASPDNNRPFVEGSGGNRVRSQEHNIAAQPRDISALNSAPSPSLVASGENNIQGRISCFGLRSLVRRVSQRFSESRRGSQR